MQRLLSVDLFLWMCALCHAAVVQRSLLLRARILPGVGLEYAKSSVMLKDFMPSSYVQAELELGSNEQSRARARLIAAVYAVNGKLGSRTICASSGKVGQAPRE